MCRGNLRASESADPRQYPPMKDLMQLLGHMAKEGKADVRGFRGRKIGIMDRGPIGKGVGDETERGDPGLWGFTW